MNECYGNLWGIPIYSCTREEMDMTKNTIWCSDTSKKMYYMNRYIGIVSDDLSSVEDFQEDVFKILFEVEMERGNKPYFLEEEEEEREEEEEELPAVEELETNIEDLEVANAADLFLETWRDNIDEELGRLLNK